MYTVYLFFTIVSILQHYSTTSWKRLMELRYRIFSPFTLHFYSHIQFPLSLTLSLISATTNLFPIPIILSFQGKQCGDFGRRAGWVEVEEDIKGKNSDGKSNYINRYSKIIIDKKNVV